MVSLIKSWDLKTIQFFCPSSKVRKSIRLGKINFKAAEAIKTKLKEIISYRLEGIPWSPKISRWIASMADDFARKPNRVGFHQLLEEGFEKAEEGELYVVNRYRDSKQNSRRTFNKIVQKAGLNPFANILSNRQTKLTRMGYSVHLLSALIGNTEKVMQTQYFQANNDDYSNNSQWTLAKGGAQPMHIPVHQGNESNGTESNLIPQVHATCGIKRIGTESCEDNNRR